MPPTFYAKRPRSVTIVLWGVFFIGVWQAGRAGVLMHQLALLTQYMITPHPRVQIAGAVLWLALFSGGGWMLWRRRPLSRQLVPLLFLLFALADVSERLIWMSPARSTGVDWLRIGVLYFCWILFSFWALNRPKTKPYFMEMRPEP